MKINYIIAGLMAMIFLAGCEKNTFRISNYITAGEQAQVKINFFSMYRALPVYQIKVNDVRVSSNLSISPNPTPFPGGGLNTGGASTADYLAINPGVAKVAISLPKIGTNDDSLQLATTSPTLDAGKKYSLYFADTATNMISLLVADTLARPDSGYAKYKFVNLMPDVPALDLYIGTIKVASNIPYKGVSPSFLINTNSSSTTWGIRTVNGITNLITYASASSINNQRVYTVIARGYNGITATTDIRSRKISLIFNE
ncbi:MAG: DUF4397 domain-containing protein [Chitinophagaceae bacterium]|nr:DUF4397 domain-containing protein [Chitinophagaceae bacterium]